MYSASSSWCVLSAGSLHQQCCQAAAASEQSVDIKQLFQNALETPKQLSDLPQIPKPKLDIDKLPSPTAPAEGECEASMHKILAVKSISKDYPNTTNAKHSGI